MYGRRSAGKRLRMDESQQEGQYDQQGQYSQQQQQYYGGQDSNTSGGSYSNQDAQEEAFDPIAFYQQQRSEMLIDSAQHVQASQIEIQQAQLDAQQRERLHQEAFMTTGQEQQGGRRSRSAAAAAKAALSMMSDDMENVGAATPARAPSPTISPARSTRPRVSRGGGFGSASRRGRPAGTTAAVMKARRQQRGDHSPEEGTARRGRPRKSVADIMPEDESSLYFIIRNGKASLQQVLI